MREDCPHCGTPYEDPTSGRDDCCHGAEAAALRRQLEGAMSLDALTEWLTSDEAEDTMTLGPNLRRQVADAIRERFGAYQRVNPHKVVMAYKGFAIIVEDISRGSFSDDAAHAALSAINLEARKTMAVLDRPDILAELS